MPSCSLRSPDPTSTTLGQGMKARLLMSALPPCYLCFETNCDIFQVSMFLALIFFLCPKPLCGSQKSEVFSPRVLQQRLEPSPETVPALLSPMLAMSILTIYLQMEGQFLLIILIGSPDGVKSSFFLLHPHQDQSRLVPGGDTVPE